MNVSTNYNLIPYPDHRYHVLPYSQDNWVAHRDRWQEGIEPHKRLRRPPSAIKTDTIHFDFGGQRYDSTRWLQYSDTDQVGQLVDVYA